MADLHPFFVHFPISLIFVASLFDGFAAFRGEEQQHRTAFILQIGSALAALPAAFSGNLAETAIRSNEKLVGGVAETLDLHTSMGNILVWVIILFAAARIFAVLEKKDWALSGWVFPALGFLLAGLTLFTGLVGGELSREILRFFVDK